MVSLDSVLRVEKSESEFQVVGRPMSDLEIVPTFPGRSRPGSGGEVEVERSKEETWETETCSMSEGFNSTKNWKRQRRRVLR